MWQLHKGRFWFFNQNRFPRRRGAWVNFTVNCSGKVHVFRNVSSPLKSTQTFGAVAQTIEKQVAAASGHLVSEAVPQSTLTTSLSLLHKWCTLHFIRSLRQLQKASNPRCVSGFTKHRISPAICSAFNPNNLAIACFSSADLQTGDRLKSLYACMFYRLVADLSARHFHVLRKYSLWILLVSSSGMWWCKWSWSVMWF